MQYPAYGQQRVANELRKEGIVISPDSVRSVWLRRAAWRPSKKRVKASRIKAAQEDIFPAGS